MTTYFECEACGETHEGLPDLVTPAPYHWYTIPVEEREKRARRDSETCVIDDEDYFVRSVLLIPIVGTEESFGFGVWTTLSKENFGRFVELGGKLGPKPSGPFFGWFSTRLQGYPDTVNLKAQVHLQEAPLRPLVELEPTNHPLSVEQRIGMTPARAKDLCRAAWHPAEHEIDESLAQYVECGRHDHGHATFVCQHLSNGEAEAMFWPEDHRDTPWPDAWCERCDAVLSEEGEWNERSEAFAGVTLRCSGCYEEIRQKLFS
jgi:hypothetical protein